MYNKLETEGKKSMKVLLIIPAYNEAESLPSLLVELKKYPQYDCIVIDDASSDDTSLLAQHAGAHVVTLPTNLGLSGAVQTGFLYAVENKYDVCVQIDGDGQHIPSEIEKLTSQIKNGYHIVIGSRFLEERPKYEQSLSKIIAAGYLAKMIQLFSGMKLTDPTSGMRAFTNDVFSIMAVHPNERPEPDTIMGYIRQGKKVVEVQVDMRERTAGESYLTFGRAMRYMVENTLACILVAIKTKRVRRND